MDISINGTKADITLESETKLGEVLAALDEWLSGQNLFLSGLEVDGKMYGSRSMEEAFGLALDTIASVDIKTSGWADLMMEALLSIREELRPETGESRLPQKTESVKESPAEKKLRWEASPAALFLQKNAAEVHSLALKALDASFPAEGALSLIGERIRELENPRGEIAGARPLAEEIAGRLTDLPLDMQTGKDSRAAETVALFSALAEKLFRLIFLFRAFGMKAETIPVPGEDPADKDSGTRQNLKEYIEEFSAALRELAAAYENKDTVLVGDLAEYELAPRLLRLWDMLENAGGAP